MRHDMRLLDADPITLSVLEIERLQTIANNLFEMAQQNEEVSVCEGQIFYTATGEEIGNC